MSFTAAALKLLADRGLTAHEIAEIAAANETPVISAYEKRKAYDRQRKAEKRAENKSGGMSGGNPPDPAPNEIDILTPTRETKTEPKGSSKSLVQEEKRKAVGSCLQTAFVIPDDIPAEPWAAWVEMRIRMRKKPTPHACSLAVAELRRLRDEEGWPPGDVLNHCTMNSYQGIFPPKRGRNERSDRDPTTVALERLIGNVGTHARTG